MLSDSMSHPAELMGLPPGIPEAHMVPDSKRWRICGPQVGSSACPVCGAAFAADEAVLLNGAPEEARRDVLHAVIDESHCAPKQHLWQ